MHAHRLSASKPTRSSHIAEVLVTEDRRMLVETVVTQTMRMQRRIGDVWMDVVEESHEVRQAHYA